MIIQASHVSLSAQSDYARQTVEAESLRVWKERPASPASVSRRSGPADTVTLSEELPCGAKDRALIHLVEKMVETFTGRKIKIRPYQAIREHGLPVNSADPPAPRNAANGAERAGWGVRTTRPRPFTRSRPSISGRKGSSGPPMAGNEVRPFARAVQGILRGIVHQSSPGDAKAVDPLVSRSWNRAAASSSSTPGTPGRSPTAASSSARPRGTASRSSPPSTPTVTGGSTRTTARSVTFGYGRRMRRERTS
jgi:hypothetical protein